MGKTWELRMIGGPYDGWKIPCAGERPPRGQHFVGLPYANDFIVPASFSEAEKIPAPRHLHLCDYRLELGVEDRDRGIAVYIYRGPETRRVY